MDRERMTDFKNRLQELFFPTRPVCFACDRDAVTNEWGLCAGCAAAIRPAPPLPALPFLDGVQAGLLFESVMQHTMHRFKYRNARYLAPRLAQWMEIPASWQVEGIVPVPLHPKRKRQRGYDQCLLLAKALSGQTGLPVYPTLLRRVRQTESQVRSTLQERRENLKDAFEAEPEVRGRSLLLIDDVITTGSTLCECARALRKAGAAQVYGLCVLSAFRPRR